MAATLKVQQVGAPLARHPSITHAEFSKHWLQSHAAIVTPFFLACGNIVEYTQIHLPDLRDRVGDLETKEKLRQFDGVAFLQCEGQLDLEKSSDEAGREYYRKVILVDERRFLHEESGSSPPIKGSPTLRTMDLDAVEWRRAALEVGGVEHVIIRGKKVSE